MSDPTLVGSAENPAVRLERWLADPPSVVWRAITQREQLARWFPCDVIVDGGSWRVGASISFVFPPEVIDLTLTGTVLEVEEPRSLAFTWGDETLRISLVADGGGTRLVLIDELAASHAARNAAGWEDCLDHLEGREVVASSWRPRFERYRTAFSSVLGPQEGPPEGYKGDDLGE